MSKITPEAEKWLKQNLDVNIEDIINNQMKDKNFDASKFLNDLNIKMKERKKSLFEMNLSNKTLENIYYMRNEDTVILNYSSYLHFTFLWHSFKLICWWQVALVQLVK